MKKIKQLSNGEISVLCLELSLLLQAGIGVGEGLHLLADDSGDERLREMALQADQGETLGAAMRQAECFPGYVSGLVAVGERTGHLEEALRALSAYYDGRERSARHIRSALSYPAVLFTMMLVVIVVLLTRVLPVFNDVYASLGAQLTGAAGALLALGRALDAAMPVLCALLAAVLAFLAVFALSDSFRDAVLASFRRRQSGRGVAGRLASAHIAQALAMGLRSGLNAEEALELAAQLTDETPRIAEKLRRCQDRLLAGDTLAAALQAEDILPAAYCRMLDLAQRGGSGDQAMEEIARRVSEGAEESLERTVGRVEPVLVIVTSVMVGAILLSVMLPLMHIMSAIG